MTSVQAGSGPPVTMTSLVGQNGTVSENLLRSAYAGENLQGRVHR